MSQRITQKSIATALGLHVSTVSKALKGDPAVARSTRKRVRDKADELGFVPDPLLGALAAYRKQLKPEAFHATIGWVFNHPRSQTMVEFSGYEDYLAGAQVRAEALGYRIEPFWVGENARSVEHLERVWQARGIQGLIIAPQYSLKKALALHWDRYASVGIGYSLNERGLDRVTNDHFATMEKLLERLQGIGYRRVGCYLWETDNLRMGQRIRAAFSTFGQDLGGEIQSYRDLDRSSFIDWVRRGRFDVVVGRGMEEMKVLEAAGYAIPESIGFAGYALSQRETMVSGMQHNNFRIGSAAVEWVSGKLQRAQRGCADSPEQLLITSRWLDNGSLAKRKRSGKCSGTA